LALTAPMGPVLNGAKMHHFETAPQRTGPKRANFNKVKGSNRAFSGKFL